VTTGVINGPSNPIRGWGVFFLRAYLIVDLGFGDAGKGLLTDFLARQTGAELVVRYNGGAQAGHNVVCPDGRQHTFAQFGSATFVPGVKTYLSHHMVVHPTALLVEGDRLVRLGADDAFSRLKISAGALVITPFHQAANHIRELARGDLRHGSCGAGVGEAFEDALFNPADAVRAGDLSNPLLLRRKLALICEQKRYQMADLLRDKKLQGPLVHEWSLFERPDVIDTWIERVARITSLGLVAPDSLLQRWLAQSNTVLFEGAQGVLLDAERGFHPYTTWSNCTTENALDLIQTLAPGSPTCQIGVLRAHAVRHGPGPLPSETNELAARVSEHNQFNEWQGTVRYGWFDAVLARYALAITGRLDSLFITHLDLLPRLKFWPCCTAYRLPPGFDSSFCNAGITAGLLQCFQLSRSLSLAQRTRFTESLAAVTPLLESFEANEETVIAQIEAISGQTVGLVSNGPGAAQVRLRHPLAELTPSRAAGRKGTGKSL
jgi:adenylosuccinate synthase